MSMGNVTAALDFTSVYDNLPARHQKSGVGSGVGAVGEPNGVQTGSQGRTRWAGFPRRA
jgi:hypothetical protein